MTFNKRSLRSASLKSSDSRLLLSGAFGMVGGADATGCSGKTGKAGSSTILGASFDGTRFGSGLGRLASDTGGAFFGGGGDCSFGAISCLGGSAIVDGTGSCLGGSAMVDGTDS